MGDIVNVYENIKWYRKKPSELSVLFPWLKSEIRVYSTSGLGPLAPLALNLVKVNFVPQGFTYVLSSFEQVFGYSEGSLEQQEIFVPFTDVYMLYATMQDYETGDWTDTYMTHFNLGELTSWKEKIPEPLVVAKVKEGGQAKIFFSALRAFVGLEKTTKLDVRVVGSVLISAGSVYYLLARALVLLGKSGTMYLYDPNEIPAQRSVRYGLHQFDIIHVKEFVAENHVMFGAADVILDDAGIEFPQVSKVPFVSLKGAKVMPGTMIEKQPFYGGTEYRTYRGKKMGNFLPCMGLDMCPDCTQVGRLANSLTTEAFFGPWLVLAFAFLGIVPCRPFPGVQDVVEKGRLYREVSLKKTVDIRDYDTIVHVDPSVKWRAALSLLMDGMVDCGGPDKLTVLAGQKFFISERRVRPVKTVQYSGAVHSFLSGKKVFMHDVISRELEGVIGSLPQEADVIVATSFPSTRTFKNFPKYWLRVDMNMGKMFPYVFRTALRGQYETFYVYEYDVASRIGPMASYHNVDRNVLDLIREFREGPDIPWDGPHRVVLVGKDGMVVPCCYTEKGAALITGLCQPGEEEVLATYLVAKNSDVAERPVFVKEMGYFFYYMVQAEDIAMVFRQDVVDREFLDFLPRGQVNLELT